MSKRTPPVIPPFPPEIVVPYLAGRSGRSPEQCASAYQLAGGNIASALRTLLDRNLPIKYGEWYYGGPFIRVANPLIDLPRRVFGLIIDPSLIADVESDGLRAAERYVAPFRDENSIGEILPVLWQVQSYSPATADRFADFPTLQFCLLEAYDRVATKIRRTTNSRKTNWLTLALEQICEASRLTANGKHAETDTLLQRTAQQIQTGNRANRRRTVISLGPPAPEDT